MKGATLSILTGLKWVFWGELLQLLSADQVSVKRPGKMRNFNSLKRLTSIRHAEENYFQ
jgi:hypothetical protein